MLGINGNRDDGERLRHDCRMKHWEALSKPVLIFGGLAILGFAWLTFQFGVIDERPGLALVSMGLGALMFWRVDTNAKARYQDKTENEPN